MTAEEMLQSQIDDAGFQVRKTLEGFLEPAIDDKPFPGIMSVREQIAHLCEAYTAAKAHAVGESYSWGTLKVDVKTLPELKALFEKLRAEAIEAAWAAPDGMSLLNDYILAHDYYHVGQLVLLRLYVDPDWNVYSIYR